MLKESKKSIPEVGPGSTNLYLQTDSAGTILSASSGLLSFISIPPIHFTIEYKQDNPLASPVLQWNAMLPQPLVDMQTQDNNWFEKFFLHSNQSLCISGTDGFFKKVNQSFVDLIGYSAEELCSQPYINFIHPADRQKTLEIAAYMSEGNNLSEFENRYCCRNGAVKWLSWSTTLLEEDSLVLAIARDVTDEKKAEVELERKTVELNQAHYELNAAIERYQVFVQQSSEIIWRCELLTPLNTNDNEEEQMFALFQGYLVECNDQMARFYGYGRAADVIGKKVADFFDPNEPVTRQVVRDFIQNGYKIYRRLSMHIDYDGNKRYFLNNLVGVVEGNRLLRVWTTQNDITEQRMAEKANRYQASVLENVFDAVVSSGTDLCVRSWNQAAEKLFGVKTSEIMGRNIRDFLQIDYHNTSREDMFKHLFEKGHWSGEGSFLRKTDNRKIYFRTSVGLLKDADGNVIDIISINRDITASKAAAIELQHSQTQLKEYSDRITNILAGITDGFIAVDKNLHIFLWNHSVERITGLEAKNVIGSHIDKIFPNFAGTTDYQHYIDAINRGVTVKSEHYIPGLNCWLETSVYPFSGGGFIYFRDITERKKQAQLLELEKDVLEINAQPAASLKNTVDYFLEGLENTFPGMMCSVVVLEDDKKTIRHLSAPSLPVEFVVSIDGAKIGPSAGSCGTAIWRKERVITSDTTADPLWSDLQEVVQRYGVQSCWSFPVMDAQKDVMATMAVYHKHPQTPTVTELNMLNGVVNLLRVIIENKSAEARIKLSNERYLLITKATNDAIWDWDVTTNSLYWGEGIYTLFGYKPGYIDSSLKFWEANIHEIDRDRVINGISKFINGNNVQVWEEEYRFKKANGAYALVYDRGFLIFDHTGKITRMVGSMQDITEKKEMERRLLKQELDKQKLVAQAVVNAQEKERAEIGKELHDNVNQILSTAKLYLELAQTDDEGRIDLIARSTDNISDAINEIRAISRSLVPPSVGDLGLIDSIQDLVENIKATRRLNVEFRFEGLVDTLLDEKRKLMLFRIIQEQVNNVLKHAGANNLVIELIVDTGGNSVDLTISDDGKGFEVEKIRAKKGVGLSNISSRAQLFNGHVQIVSAAGEGCKLKINVPISNI